MKLTTIEDIKKQLKEKSMTYQDLANELGVARSTVANILSGASKLTTEMRKHIERVLNMRYNQIVIYQITVPDEVVELMFANEANLTQEKKIEHLKAIIVKNMESLAQYGAGLEIWNAYERNLLGLPPAE